MQCNLPADVLIDHLKNRSKTEVAPRSNARYNKVRYCSFFIDAFHAPFSRFLVFTLHRVFLWLFCGNGVISLPYSIAPLLYDL